MLTARRHHTGRAGARRGGPAAALSLALLVVALAACSDDAGDGGGASADTSTGAGARGPAELVDLDELALAAGGAPAASGAGLDEPPGPADRDALPDVGEVAASITAADGTVTGCCLLVASDREQRQQGLMEVTDLGGYQGMVFVWDTDASGGFWMFNTVMPLSIAWFDADGDFVSSADMEPCDGPPDDCPTYPAEGSYRFAVEVPQGELDELGVGPGSRLALGGACAEASGGA